MHALRTWLAALAIVASSGCRSDAAPVPFDAHASLFEPDFRFACSPREDVRCTGVFDVRRTTEGDEPPATVRLPVTGEQALGVRLDSLRAAKRSIRIQALIFRADESGLAIADLLKSRKAEGLDVRVIVDATSNLDWETQWMYFDLKRHGIEVEGYEAGYLQWITAERLHDPLHANKRFHDKMWIVDGEDDDARMAIVGGLNIANEYFRIANDPLMRWHDQDLVLRGPIVADVMAAFDRNYDFFKDIKQRRPGPLDPDRIWAKARVPLAELEAVTVPHWIRPDLAARVAACTGHEVPLEFSPAAIRFVQSRPRMQETFIAQAYLNQIERAQRSILIANAYFVPSRAVTAALRRAVDRGVEVVVLTNSPETNDIAAVASMSRFSYRNVMMPHDHGAKVHEWIGPSIGEGTLHAKYAVFDERAVIVGSYNLDPRSERLNSETVVAVEDPALAGRMAQRFREELLPRSRPITWDDAVKFRRPHDLADKFQLLFAMPVADWL